ncbi:unnamed protein product, partial [Laminaria digitata]
MPAPIPASPIPSENTDGGFTGDLFVFALPDLLEFLMNQRASGVLYVESEHDAGSVQLHEGDIVALRAPGCPSLARELVQEELLSDTQLKQHIVHAKDLERDAVVAQVVLTQGL